MHKVPGSQAAQTIQLHRNTRRPVAINIALNNGRDTRILKPQLSCGAVKTRCADEGKHLIVRAGTGATPRGSNIRVRMAKLEVSLPVTLWPGQLTTNPPPSSPGIAETAWRLNNHQPKLVGSTGAVETAFS